MAYSQGKLASLFQDADTTVDQDSSTIHETTVHETSDAAESTLDFSDDEDSSSMLRLETKFDNLTLADLSPRELVAKVRLC